MNERGLKFDGVDMLDIAQATSGQLNSPELTDELGLQVVKNLLFLARCFYANKMAAAKRDEDVATEEEGEAKTALSWIIGRISGVIRSERNAKKVTSSFESEGRICTNPDFRESWPRTWARSMLCNFWRP